MNGYITTSRRSRVVDMPICMAETELRRGRVLTVGQIHLVHGQRLELCALAVGIVTVLTPGVLPVYMNTGLGLCSAGLYQTLVLTSPLAVATANIGTAAINSFYPRVIEAPGVYTVLVSNNTTNMDFAVAVTGAVKTYF